MASISAFRRTMSIAACTVLLLAACDGGSANKPGQTLVTINGSEVTVLQLNGELRGLEAEGAAHAERIRKQALESLIDRQLLVNEALQNKLDRDPEVLSMIERARALILSQAYLRKKAVDQSAPTDHEIENYYEKHPELFAKRKLFDMRQVMFAEADFKANLKNIVETAKSVDEVAAWMDANKIASKRGQLLRTTTELPSQLAKNIDTLGNGKPFVLKDGTKIAVASLNYVKDAPVSREAALPQIAQFLGNRKGRQAAAAEIARLRHSAKIEYANQPAQEAGASAAARPATADVPAPVKQDKSMQEHIQRGVAGLK